MTLEPSAWRTNDAVRFDAALDAVNAATARIFELVDTGALALAEAVQEVQDLRAAFQRVNGFDRQAVDDFVAMIGPRVAHLEAGRG